MLEAGGQLVRTDQLPLCTVNQIVGIISTSE
jgi:hypothetical protein